MVGPIKCSYEGCFRRFDTVEAMKKHKAKDAAHKDFYCKRCDADCIDDTEYLIHQLSSPKHIACPLCGIEFKSEGGRERHVGISHKAKQSIECVGCRQVFDSASRMIGHIENNQCRAITKDDFYKHKAEKEIREDDAEGAEEGLYEGTAFASPLGSGVSNTSNVIGDRRFSRGEASNEGVAVAEDVQGAKYESSTELAGMHGTIIEGVAQLGVDEYPSLGAATSSNPSSVRNVASYPSIGNAEPGDHLNTKKTSGWPPSKPSSAMQEDKFKAATAWNNFAQRPGLNKRQSLGVNKLDFDSTVNGSAVESKTSVATRGTRASQYDQSAMRTNNLIPPAARAENQDPNAPHAQVQTQVRLQMPSQLDLQSYWDPIQQSYICPGMKCNRRLKSVQAFHEHLLSDTHSGGTVQCPSCFKRFKTTSALVAHAESGSTRCDLRNSTEFDLVMRSITAGLIKVDGTWSDGSHRYSAVPVDEW